ncbi:MAG: RtcB family protein [Polyangiales bacterium]
MPWRRSALEPRQASAASSEATSSFPRGSRRRGAWCVEETIVEEMPQAYKDVADVVDVVARGGIASKVVRIRPIGCVKG